MVEGALKPDTDKPIGIVAGGGGIVSELISALQRRSTPFVVAAIKGEADEDLSGNKIVPFNWGEIGKIISFFHEHECKQLILLGHIRQRPDFKSILGDTGTLKRLPKIIAAMRGGDDSLLHKVIGLIELEGFQVIGLREAAPELLLEQKQIGFTKDFASFLPDIEKAKIILKDLGRYDIGQALVIFEGRVLAVEGAEGTDNMLKRIKMLRDEKRITQRKRTGLLIKAAKPNQDLRADLPTIGPDTIKLASEAGLAGIICEAGTVLVADKNSVYDLIDRHKLFLVGESDFHDG